MTDDGGELVRGADERHLVARADPACPARADEHVAGRRDHRDRGERPVQLAQRRRVRRGGPGGEEPHRPTATAPGRPRPGRPRPPTGRTAPPRRGPPRPPRGPRGRRPGWPSCATTRTSARSRRASSAVSSADRSSSWAQITAIAPARPADISVSSARACPVISGTPQAAIIRASAGAGSSSTTTAGTPDSVSCSTIRSPTPGSPQTITCPRQSACVSPTWLSIPVWDYRHVRRVCRPVSAAVNG